MGVSQTFIAASKPLKEALKSANLLKTLKLNTLLCGDPGTGRHTLASLMMPDAPVVAADSPDLFAQVEKHSQLIVDRFERLETFPKLAQALQKHATQIVAIAEEGYKEEQGAFFSVRIVLPPLAERPEDVPPLVEKFKRETLALFGEEEDFKVDPKRLDLSRNAFSLRKSVMLQYFARHLSAEELMVLNEHFFHRAMEGEDLYRSLLYLYEVPLIRAGMKEYKSQLKMSQAFGLNRNTLRKKIGEWKTYLDPIR